MTADYCCTVCRGPLGLCQDKTCLHHIEKQAAEDRDDRNLRLYSDPTARQAVNNLSRRPRTRGRRK